MVPNPLDCSFMRVFTALYIGYYHLLPGCYRGMSYAVSIAYPDSMSSSVSTFGHQTSFRVKKICFFFDSLFASFGEIATVMIFWKIQIHYTLTSC